MPETHADHADLLRRLFEAAVAAADPAASLSANLPDRPPGRVVVLGAGKAGARMAQAVEAQWGPCEGLIVVPYGTRLPTRSIELVEAAHPVPDAAGLAATARILDLAASLGPDDFALFLISGGGSSLLCAPAEGWDLAEKQALNGALLASGLPIERMNVLRKRASKVKGGRLALAAHPASHLTLAISDVPGDHPDAIASGPTVPSRGQETDLPDLEGLIPPPLLAKLERAGPLPEPEHACFQQDYRLIATPMISLTAAAKVAEEAGLRPVIRGDAIEGEAREVGRQMAKDVAARIKAGEGGGTVLLSGGETTVTLGTDPGWGGRNVEFLLSFALHAPHSVSALAADTDGIDGMGPHAGGVWLAGDEAPSGLMQKHLQAHDAAAFFDQAGRLLTVGPTHTNVNDFRAVLF